MGSVFVIGSINTDLVAYVERLPIPGQTVGDARFVQAGGGKGANQAVAAARAGAVCIMYGAVGDDAYGRARVVDLAAAGVVTDHVTVLSDCRSGVALICVDKHGENQIAVAPGANAEFRLDKRAFGGVVAPGDVVLLQNEIDVVVTAAAIRHGRDCGATTMWNVAPALDSIGLLEREAIAQADFLIVNAGELDKLHPRRVDESVIMAAKRVIAELGCSRILVTLGADGAALVDRHGVQRQAAHRVQAIDTVGAGDCFSGVFAASTALGQDPVSALRLAVAAAGICVTCEGAQGAMPGKSEIRVASDRPS